MSATTTNQPVYLTTTLPYVNDKPHLGHALEAVLADALARFYRSTGREVFFNFGTDEHGLKIYRKAQDLGQEPQAYVDDLVKRFTALRSGLNLSYDNFIRTTNPEHMAAAGEMWRRCQAAGDIYKKKYRVKYCVGCELEKTDSELVRGYCPIHPEQELEMIEEENYFFRFSRYQDYLLKLYNDQPDFVVPTSRLNEIKSFVSRGLVDFSISRLKSKMPWGVSVPDDPDQVMYVWFDALTNYISALGWPDDQANFRRFWPVIQLAGKDNLRQQVAMWQAMLASAGLPASRQIMIHGFINDASGHKMSKSLGNVIDPLALVDDWGADVLRYFLLRHIHPFEDSNFSLETFRDNYNAHLANGLGNLTSRIMKLATKHLTEPVALKPVKIPAELTEAWTSFAFNQAMDYIWERIGRLDGRIQATEPYRLIKTEPERARADIAELVAELFAIGCLLEPAMPQTAARIKELTANNQMPDEPLFTRRT